MILQRDFGLKLEHVPYKGDVPAINDVHNGALDLTFASPTSAKPRIAAGGVRPIAMFDTASPVRSGWGWGQQYLKDGVIAVDAKVGKGRVLLFGPEILQRAQPHGTFKLLFNSLYLSILN